MKSPAAAEASAAAREFDRRAARAELLAAESAAASEPLRFAAGLYRVQSAVAGAIETAAPSGGLTGHLDLDLPALEPSIPPILEFAAREGPALLAAAAASRLDDAAAARRTRLLVFWEGGTSSGDDYLSRAILRPYVEALRASVRAPARVHRRGGCPFCGAPPAIAARRDADALEGARRVLGCLLCGSEWTFQRIRCPSCFEEDPVKLPNFQSDRHPSVRIEACETCRRYVKSLDLSTDARPIPEVDDLVSLSLDLWAAEEGFSRIEPGLAGL